MKALPDKEDRMQLTKEVKDILEGIHYFLVESLKNESLKGEVECQRRGLLLQLQALREPYPVLHFKTTFDPNANIRNGTTMGYYNTVENLSVNNGSSRMSTSSSGSTNYSASFSNDSSTGYSGDGIISSRDLNDTSEVIQSASDDFSSENYEDFDDLLQIPEEIHIVSSSVEKSSKTLMRKDSFTSSGFDDKEDDECNVDPVPFRFLLAKCSHHGMITKRSKGLIRNTKSFIGVLVGTLLYLYQKETDDRQKKVIEVIGYLIREPHEEGTIQSKRKEFSFELVQPGKKTHMFQCSKRKDKEQWVDHLKRAESASFYQRTCLERVEEAPAVDVDIELNESDSETYEVLGSDNDLGEFSSPLQVSVVGVDINEDSNYYTVPDCANQSGYNTSTVVNKPQRLPPERPPPPLVSVRRPPVPRPPMPRPLPRAPEEENIDEEIYCEIDEDSFEAYQSTSGLSRTSPRHKSSESVNSSLMNSSINSLSQEIFDTINERLTPLPEENNPQNISKYDDRESYDVPNERVVPFPWANLNRSLPKLPPKGVPCQSNEDDSEYKVPTFSCYPENLYSIPASHPVPVKSVERTDKIEITTISSEDLQQKVDFIQRNSTRLSDIETTQTNTNIDYNVRKSVALEIIDDESPVCSQLDLDSNNPKKNSEGISSNSVKDLVAKLDKMENGLQKSEKTHAIYRTVKQRRTQIYEGMNINFSNNFKKIEALQITPYLGPLSETIKSKKNNEVSSCERQSSDKLSTVSSESSYSSIDVVHVAKFDYVSEEVDRLSFSRGDEILVQEVSKEVNWWRATIKGKEGFVAKEYLRRKE